MYVAMGLLKIVASVSFLLLFMLQYFFLQELENIIYSLHTYKKSRSKAAVPAWAAWPARASTCTQGNIKPVPMM
jgi:hypothetical protein